MTTDLLMAILLSTRKGLYPPAFGCAYRGLERRMPVRRRHLSLVAVINRHQRARSGTAAVHGAGFAQRDVELCDFVSLRRGDDWHEDGYLVAATGNAFDATTQRGVVDVGPGAGLFGPPDEIQVTVRAAISAN